MRRLFRRPVLWLLAVVIVPLAILTVMQYRFLRSLEQKTISAETNLLRNALETASSDIETRYRRAAVSALSLTPRQLADVAGLGAHFRRHPIPGVRTFFAMRFEGGMYEVGFFDVQGVERWANAAEAEAVKMATVSWHVAHKWDRLLPQPTILVDERDLENRVLLRPVTDDAMHIVGVAGAVLDETLARAQMASIASSSIRRGRPDIDPQVRVGKRWESERAGGNYITAPLAFVFTDWRVGVRNSCATPEQIAAYNFQINALWTGGAFVVLTGAIALAIGALARQMRLSQMKSDFVSNVSHELRTPLSSIRVFGEYMRLGRVTSPDKIREYGEYIEAESRRLTQLINNILDFSRIESAEKKYRFAETDLVELVEQTVEAFAVPLREKGMVISFRAALPLPPALHVDRDAVAQVVVNLLDNAVKYSNGGTDIAVEVGSGRDEVRISVRDSGIGIPAAEQKKIFEKFYRVGSGLVHDIKGSGLGLSIVEHVARAHGGRVELVSAPGEGSTFTIVLPLHRPASGDAVVPAQERRPQGESG